jgi:hypothetical protein
MAKEKSTEIKSQEIQRKYNAASTLCDTLDTVVPAAMSFEQKKFNEKLIASVPDGDVDKYVADKLKYKTVDELCDFFGKEQIDAIATAIWQHENTGDSIIVADQTGVGKGRVAAGLIRYGILGLGKIPIFFTEKAHLISDIYRDLINIGFDAGVPKLKRIETKTKGKEYTREEIEKIVLEDANPRNKETEGELRVDYDFGEDEIKNLRSFLEKEENQEIFEEVVELYTQHFLETGGEETKIQFVKNPNYKEEMKAAVEAGRMVVRPLLLNPVKVKDIEGNILYEGSKKANDEIFKSKDIPNDYKLIASAYSQIANPYEKEVTGGKKVMKDKIKTLWKYSKDTILILDESHNASGMKPDGTKSNTAEIMFSLVKNAAMTTFLSATYAKRADNMPLYSLTTAIREAGLTERDLIQAFVKGGNSLQEATSAELVRNGELLRREKAISGRTVYEYAREESETGVQQIVKIDVVASLFQIVKDFEQRLSETVRSKNSMYNIKDVKFAGKTSRFSFLLFNFFILGLKVKQTAEQAIKNLNEGKKPIIAIGNTMESAFDKLQKTFALFSGEEDKYKLGEAIPNDFRLYCAFLLKYTYRLKFSFEAVNDQGEKEDISETIDISSRDGIKRANRLYQKAGANFEVATEILEATQSEYAAALAKIMQVTTGIPISPIDMIVSRIEKAGFSIEEITGRKRKIDIVEDSGYYKYIISDRKIRKTEDIVRDYNQNKVDALLINQAGATGLSMHALPNDLVTEVPETPPITLENKKEVKQRCMVITQMELDINKEVQKIGRINRTGQVYPPEYYYLISAIPSESRLTSMMEKKLRSLSANVSSNQTQFAYQFTADDFFSEVAVDPCNRVLKDNELTHLAGDSGEVGSGKDIYDLTKSLYFAPFAQQQTFYTEFSKALTEEIVSLKSQGLYTGSMENKDYSAKSLQVYPFVIGNNEARTSFGRHVFIDKAEVQLFDQKNIEQFVKEKLKSNLVLKPRYSTDIYQYPTQKEYAAKSSEYLDHYVTLYDTAAKNLREETAAKIGETNKQIADYDNQLKKFGKLDEVIKMKESVAELNERKQQIISEITAALGKPDALDVVTSKTVESQSVEEQIKKLTEKIDSPEYKEVYDNRSDYDRINREKRRAEDDIERYQRSLERSLEKFTGKKEIIEYIRKYVGKIGNVFSYVVNDENRIFDGDLDAYKYEYNKVIDEKVVLYGVSWPVVGKENAEGVSAIGYDLTKSNIRLKFAKAVGTVTISLSEFLASFNERDQEQGRENRIKLTDSKKSYEKRWNKYLATIDTGRQEERYFLTGSLLKGFVAAYQNGYQGSIVKYNTNENKVRIGIELSEVAIEALKQRYSEELDLPYPIFFDSNVENTKNFIYDYLWYAYTGAPEEESSSSNIKGNRGMLTRARGNRIGFEITTSGSSRAAVWFRQPNVTRAYDVDESRIATTKEDMLKELKVTFAFSAAKEAYGLFTLANRIVTQNKLEPSLNVSGLIDYEKSNKMLQEAGFEPSFNVDGITQVTSRQTPYVDFFPTNIVKYQEKYDDARWGNARIYEYPYAVTVSMEVFDLIIKWMDEEKKTMMLCTSSVWYEKSDADYTFEQFDDDIQVPELVDGGESTEFTSPLTEEVQEKVDDLINTLLKSVAGDITTSN